MVTKIEAMQDSLNVKKNNLNNKRLSRLQGVILKVLATIHPSGYSKRELPRVVARVYGKGSVITLADKDAALETAIKRNPDKEGMIRGLNDMMFFKQHNIHIGKKPDSTIGWVGEWLSPKFSVSYSRSVKSLMSQGLVVNTYAMFITDKGLARIQDRKVKVNAKSWDAFHASLRKEALGESVPQRLRVTIEEEVDGN